MRWFAILLLILQFSVITQADPVRSHLAPSRWNFFHRLNSPFLDVVEEGHPYYDEDRGDYPWIARVIQMDLFKWNPSGKSKRTIPVCDPIVWQKETVRKNLPTKEWIQEYSQFLGKCQYEWETGWKDVVTNTLGTTSLKLHPGRYPYGRHVVLQLPNKIRIKAFLAMKTDGKKRPLVIFRTGLFSNTQEFYPERFLFMQMFEQSSFNILVLESSTGSEFLKHNTSYALGGFDEGLQNFWIAQKIQDPSEPLSKHIQSVHLMGMSLGGHGVMMSALLNQFNPGPQGKSIVRSVLAFCPLLNMQETLDYHMSQGFSMDLMNYWASRRLAAIKDRIPGIENSKFIPQFFNWIQYNYKAPLIAENGEVKGLQMPPAIAALLKAPKRPDDLFWQLNHFWPWYQKIQTPVFIMSTKKDPIVSWFINSGRIEDKRLSFAGSEVQHFAFESGYHCSFPVAYDWGSMSTVFQSYFLKMSPEMEMELKEVRTPLSQDVLSEIDRQSTNIDLSFEVPEGGAGVIATVRFDKEFWTSFKDTLFAPKMKVQLPLSEMEFPIDQIVRDADEASLLRRWAYQNIQARIEGSDLVINWRVTK